MLEYPVNFRRIEIAVAVEYKVEAFILKGQLFRASLPEIHAQRQEGFPAEDGIRRIGFRSGAVCRRVLQGEQEFAAAGVDIQQLHLRPAVPVNDFPVAPGQILFFSVAAFDVGKIPAPDVGDGLLLQP